MKLHHNGGRMQWNVELSLKFPERTSKNSKTIQLETPRSKKGQSRKILLLPWGWFVYRRRKHAIDTPDLLAPVELEVPTPQERELSKPKESDLPEQNLPEQTEPTLIPEIMDSRVYMEMYSPLPGVEYLPTWRDPAKCEPEGESSGSLTLYSGSLTRRPAPWEISGVEQLNSKAFSIDRYGPKGKLPATRHSLDVSSPTHGSKPGRALSFCEGDVERLDLHPMAKEAKRMRQLQGLKIGCDMDASHATGPVPTLSAIKRDKNARFRIPSPYERTTLQITEARKSVKLTEIPKQDERILMKENTGGVALSRSFIPSKCFSSRERHLKAPSKDRGVVGQSSVEVTQEVVHQLLASINGAGASLDLTAMGVDGGAGDMSADIENLLGLDLDIGDMGMGMGMDGGEEDWGLDFDNMNTNIKAAAGGNDSANSSKSSLVQSSSKDRTKSSEGSNKNKKSRNKRRKIDEKDGDEDDCSDTDSGRRRKSNEKPNPGDSPQSKRLKCPYYQRCPEECRLASCRGQGFTEMAKLKDHLKRVHIQPLRCTRCWEEVEIYDEHFRQDTICSKRPEPDDRRISPLKLRELRFNRAPFTKDQSVEEKWAILYRVLFPDEKVVPSPYEQNEISTHMERLLIVSLEEEIVKELGDVLGNVIDIIRQRLPGIVTRSRKKAQALSEESHNDDSSPPITPTTSLNSGAESLFDRPEVNPSSTTLDTDFGPPAISQDQLTVPNQVCDFVNWDGSSDLIDFSTYDFGGMSHWDPDNNWGPVLEFSNG